MCKISKSITLSIVATGRSLAEGEGAGSGMLNELLRGGSELGAGTGEIRKVEPFRSIVIVDSR